MNTIFIYGDIAKGENCTSTQSIMRDLARCSKDGPVSLRINSSGGMVFEAVAIYNMLTRDGRKIIVDIDALAASSASFIAMAGHTIRIAQNAMMMLHSARLSTPDGNAKDYQQQLDLLVQADEMIASIYAARSKRDKNAILADMAAETWYTAKEAVAAGLADEIGQPLKVAASIEAGRFTKTPDALLAQNVGYSAQIASLQTRLTRARQVR